MIRLVLLVATSWLIIVGLYVYDAHAVGRAMLCFGVAVVLLLILSWLSRND